MHPKTLPEKAQWLRCPVPCGKPDTDEGEAVCCQGADDGHELMIVEVACVRHNRFFLPRLKNSSIDAVRPDRSISAGRQDDAIGELDPARSEPCAGAALPGLRCCWKALMTSATMAGIGQCRSWPSRSTESFGFLSLAGDTGAIIPLLQDAAGRPREENMDAAMVRVSIDHRPGKGTFLAELNKVVIESQAHS